MNVRQNQTTNRRRAEAVAQALESRRLLAGLFINPTYSVGDDPQATIFADFDNDARPDLAVANNASANVSILLNLGDGSFAPATNFATVASPRALVAADFNGDAKIDLAVESANGLSILLNTGTGSFGPAVTTTAGAGRTIAAADFNRDGKIDLATAGFSTGTAAVLLGNGAGTFAAPITYPVGSGNGSIVSADFNKDAKPDLAIANASSNNVSILLGTGAGAFAAAVNYNLLFFSNPLSITAADFDNNGSADIAVSSESTTGDNVAVLLGNAGSFGSAATYRYNMAGGVRSLVAGDFTHDGKVDLIAASTTFGGGGVLVNGGFNGSLSGGSYSFYAGPNSYAVAAADIDADGYLDAAFTSSNLDTAADDVYVLHNTPGGFAKPAIAGTFSSLDPTPVALAVADFDGNGRPDLASVDRYARSTSTAIVVRTNPALAGANYYPQYQVYSAGSDPRDLTAGDFNADGYADFAVAVYGTSSVAVFFNKGDGTFAAAVNYPLASPPEKIVAADFDQDGKLDLVALAGGSLHYLKNIGGVFSLDNTAAAGVVDTAFSLTAADFNNDGRPDFAVTSGTTLGRLSLLLTGANHSVTAILQTLGGSPTSLVARDFDNDGRLDLAITERASASPDSAAITLRLGNGDGTFAAAASFAAGNAPTSLVAADFNNDGKLDLAFAHERETNVSVLRNNGDNTFASQTNYGRNTGPIAAADFNADGRADLIAVVTGGTATLLNRGGVPLAPLFNTATFYSTYNAVTFGFDLLLNVSTVAAGDLEIVNLTTGVTASAAAVSVSFGKTITFTLPAMLPDGNYRFRLPAGAVASFNGTPAALDTVLAGPQYFRLAADATGDRTVDTRDFARLVAGFGAASPTFSQGDFNDDAAINSIDFNLLVAQYGKTLPVAAGALPAARRFAASPAIEEPDDWLDLG